MTKQATKERDEAIERLKVWVKPGDTVHCLLRCSPSRSGMSRCIQLVKFSPGEKPGTVDEAWIGDTVAQACGMRYDRKRDGIVIGGGGMDMGFAIVYDLSETLYGRTAGGYDCLGENCPSNEHSNSGYHCRCGHERNEHENEGWNFKGCKVCAVHAPGHCQKFTRHDPRGAGVHHTDGYALRHRWL